jgi:hypothetical protein
MDPPHGSNLPPSDIRKVLSNDNTRKDTKLDAACQKEIVVDGTRYHAVNVVHFYTVSSTHRTIASWSLIDHGTNGGIASDDVCIIEHPMCTVDVHGIDSHEVTGSIPIVTAGGVLSGAVSIQVLTGSTNDISSLLQFRWYEPVYYLVDDSPFPLDSREKKTWLLCRYC